MDYAPTTPIPDIWTAARAMFMRLRGAVSAKQWLYALEALVRKLVLLEALALAPQAPKPPPLSLPRGVSVLLPDPPRERAQSHGYSFRLWPRAKPHPARIRLLGRTTTRADIERDALYRAQLERLKQARLNRLPPLQRIVRRIKALGCVLEKPLPYARRLARKLRRAPKHFMTKLALKRSPRSPYIDARYQGAAERHAWFAACAQLDAAKAQTDTS